MTSPLATYLRNHEAASGAGRDLFRRAASAHRDRPWGRELGLLSTQVDQDAGALRRVMTELGVRPDRVSRTALRLAERVGRSKPNGRLLRRSALSDLIEVEALLDAVQAKAEGWRALLAAGLSTVGPVDVTELLERAEAQRERLREVHREVAATVLARQRP